MNLDVIINFRSTLSQKELMCREARRRKVTLSGLLVLLWEEDKERRGNEYKLKNYVRCVTKRLIKQGLIKIKACCEECGNNKKVEAHHENYNNPYRIKWLCRRCHKRFHS